MSYEEAIIAKQNHVLEIHGRVQQLKEESEALMRQYFAQREEEQQEMRRLVEATMAGHQSTKEAKRKLQTMKQKIGKGSSDILVYVNHNFVIAIHSSASVSGEARAYETSTRRGVYKIFRSCDYSIIANKVIYNALYPQAEVEMRRKVELIQQIRAMESVPVIRTKFVDPTETASQGLLSEMSIAEVQFNIHAILMILCNLSIIILYQ